MTWHSQRLPIASLRSTTCTGSSTPTVLLDNPRATPCVDTRTERSTTRPAVRMPRGPVESSAGATPHPEPTRLRPSGTACRCRRQGERTTCQASCRDTPGEAPVAGRLALVRDLALCTTL